MRIRHLSSPLAAHSEDKMSISCLKWLLALALLALRRTDLLPVGPAASLTTTL